MWLQAFKKYQFNRLQGEKNLHITQTYIMTYTKLAVQHMRSLLIQDKKKKKKEADKLHYS